MTSKPFSLPVLVTISSSIALLSLLACNSKKNEKLPDGLLGVKIIQVQQATKYSYFRVIENDTEYWLATEKLDLKTNDSLFYTQSYEMNNFHSRDLDRTFSSIWFIQDPASSKNNRKDISQQNNIPQRHDQKKVDMLEIKIPIGGTSIAKIYEKRYQYSGKKVIVKGLVTKINPDIMNRNWIHIQDGTMHESHFDLTITTSAKPTEGSISTFEGIIAVDKDFGSGYRYDLILESANLLGTETE